MRTVDDTNLKFRDHEDLNEGAQTSQLWVALLDGRTLPRICIRMRAAGSGAQRAVSGVAAAMVLGRVIATRYIGQRSVPLIGRGTRCAMAGTEYLRGLAAARAEYETPRRCLFV